MDKEGPKRIKNLIVISVEGGEYQFGSDVGVGSQGLADNILEQVFEGKSQEEVDSIVNKALDGPFGGDALHADVYTGRRFFGQTLGYCGALEEVDGFLKEVGSKLRERSENR